MIGVLAGVLRSDIRVEVNVAVAWAVPLRLSGYIER